MKHLLNLKALMLTMACLLGMAVSAQTLTPENGKQYRIKNVRSGKYITMTASSATAVTCSSKENSKYQFWTLEERTTTDSNGNKTWLIHNTGWEEANPDVKAVLKASATTSNASVSVVSSGWGSTNGAFTFQETTYNGQTVYAIVPRNASVGLNTPEAGGNLVMYAKTDAGSMWVLEEAEIENPAIVTIRNNRSKNYIYEGDGNAVLQGASTTGVARWIMYPYRGGVMLINAETHSIMQGPANNAAAVTSGEITIFTQTTYADGTTGFYTTQGGKDIYLNDQGAAGRVVAGYNVANDAGNKWIVNKVGEISEQEVKDILKHASSYADQIENGRYYRMLNEVRGNYAYHNYVDNRVGGAGINYNDYTQIWKAVKSGTGYKLQNVVTQKYIAMGAGQSAYSTLNTTGTVFTVNTTAASTEFKTYFNFAANGFVLHMATDAAVVNWYSGGSSLSASEWLLMEVEIDQETLDAARAEYQTYADVETAFNNLKSNRAKYETIMNGLFVDYARTTLKPEAQAMSEAEFAEAIAELPQVLKDMCLKIKNDTWTLTNGGRNMERFFRIADYRIYSQSNSICWEIGTSNAFSRLSNPTGISGDAGDVIAIMVDDNCPADAILKVEVTDGGEKDNPRTGEQTVLQRGLNLIMLKKNQDLFIFYEIDGSYDSPYYYLSRFPDMKIHIEGGVCNGYFDQTRDMTDEQWADMVASGMLQHGRVFLKGSHAVGNWPSSILLKNNPERINDICTFYNQIPMWEQEIMGVNNTYLPNIEQRFRNVYTALGTDLGNAYMYSTTYGTFYNWGTLNEILNPSVLSNQGLQWGPAHEFGHNHQALFNMVGCTEVSNNVFSNAVIYKMGAGMSRGVALSELIARFAYKNGNIRDASSYSTGDISSLTNTTWSNWMDLGIWCKTQMYWKLYQYFHLAGYDTEFFPKVFSIMRRNGLRHQNGQLVPASTDYLRFAEVCCEAANADLSDFFEMYCFFRPVETDTEKNGTACRYIDDYSTYYLYSTDAMIQRTLDYCHSFPNKIRNIGFIDDRIRQTPATYPGAPAGRMRGAMDGGGSNHVGSEGTVGMYLDYYPENYVQATGYTGSCSYRTSSHLVICNVNKASGEGAVGFKVYYKDQLIFFYNDFKFTLPRNLQDIYGYTNADDLMLVVADAQGKDWIVKVGKNYEGTLPQEIMEAGGGQNAIESVDADSAVEGTFDLQGRRIEAPTQSGLYIIDGRKVMVR